MFWILDAIETTDATPTNGWAGQWVLHRHRDHSGPHLDLRLETGGILSGLRIDAETLQPGVPAAEKGPHPIAWLTAQGHAQEAGRGRWAWMERNPDLRVILLDDGTDRRRLAWKRAPALPPTAAVRLAEWARQYNCSPSQLPDLCADGLRARQTARARCLGLAALLEAEQFDPDAWLGLLEPLDLDALNRRLEALEARLDRLHPPVPWTSPPNGPTKPPDPTDPRALARTMTLLRGIPEPPPREQTVLPRE